MTMQDAKQQAGAAMRWWCALHADGGDRGGRAQLRRCATTLDAAMIPAAHRLLRDAKGPIPPDRLLQIAIVLASVNTDNDGRFSFAQMLGQTAEGRKPGKDERQRMSPLRFQSFMVAMRSSGDAARIRALRRALALSGGAGFNVQGLIGDLGWGAFNDRTQRRWIFHYWQSFETDAEPTTTENV